MDIKVAQPDPVEFSALMWNDSFSLEPECTTLFIKVPDVKGRTTKIIRINAVQMGLKDNSVNALRYFVDDLEVYPVTILDVTIVPGR